ncbi:MAG: hypothetical protein ACREJ6_11420 [Candidatus Methylomirabilis sp.]
MDFTAPVRTGDRITAVGEIEEIIDRGIITVSLRSWSFPMRLGWG